MKANLARFTWALTLLAHMALTVGAGMRWNCRGANVAASTDRSSRRPGTPRDRHRVRAPLGLSPSGADLIEGRRHTPAPLVRVRDRRLTSNGNPGDPCMVLLFVQVEDRT